MVGIYFKPKQQRSISSRTVRKVNVELYVIVCPFVEHASFQSIEIQREPNLGRLRLKRDPASERGWAVVIFIILSLLNLR